MGSAERSAPSDDDAKVDDDATREDDPEQEPAKTEEPQKPADEDDDDDPPLDAKSDAQLSRSSPWWDVGGPLVTAAFWGSILVLCAALFRSKLLPFVDYPQHLALAGILRRMISSGAPERALFETNLASYTSLFHILVAGLALIVPIHTAGKLVISLYVALAAAATLSLLRATGRPRARAFLVMPILLGYSIAWGFVNFGLGVAVQLLVLARVLERSRKLTPPSRDSRTTTTAPSTRGPAWWLKLVQPRGAMNPMRYDAITALLALVGAYTHLLATALVYMLMLVAIVVRAQTDGGPLSRRLGQAIRTGIWLLPAIAYCFWVYKRQEAGYRNYEYATYEGNDVFAMVKLKEFFNYATGFRTDGLDAKICSIGIGLLVIGAILRDPEDEAPRVLSWLFVVSLLSYFVIPHVFWATNFVFERITFLVIVSAVVWAPRAKPMYEQGLRLMYVSVGIAAAACMWSAMGTVGVEMKDLETILDEAPKGRRVTGLVFTPKIESTAQWSLLHSPAFYVAQNGGEVAFSFTRTMSLPVHYRKETMPPDPPANFEWNPGDYRWDSPYARYFDLVLMKTTYEQGDPRASVWGAAASQVQIVAHHGKWWIFETKGIDPSKISDPNDGFKGLVPDEGGDDDGIENDDPPAP